MFSFPPFSPSPVQVPLTPPPLSVAADVQIPVSIPQTWIPYIVTALAALQQPATWKGTDAERINALEQATELIDRIANASVEAVQPFFDTPETAGVVENDSGQLWYEPLGDWIISGFLATTFSPGAAIVYNLVIPKLRLTLRANDLGGAFKVLLNGLEVHTGDSYSPIEKLLEIPVDAQAFATAHSLGDPPWSLAIQMVA